MPNDNLISIFNGVAYSMQLCGGILLASGSFRGFAKAKKDYSCINSENGEHTLYIGDNVKAYVGNDTSHMIEIYFREFCSLIFIVFGYFLMVVLPESTNRLFTFIGLIVGCLLLFGLHFIVNRIIKKRYPPKSN